MLTIRTYNVPNFPLNLRNSGFSTFLQIQTFHTHNGKNFQLNLCKIFNFLEIRTIHTYNLHNFFV